MKKLLAVLLIATVLIVITGCSGSGTDTSQTSSEGGQQATPSTSTATSTGSATTTPMTATKSLIPRKLDIDDANIPEDFKEALGKGYPIMVLLYEDNEVVSAQTKIYASRVAGGYEGKLSYLSYKIDESPSVEIGRLISVLKAGHLPYLAILDENKQLVFENSGTIDRNYLNQKLNSVVYKASSNE